MINKVTLRYFKRFEQEEFDLGDHVILAGPNNSGKSTLLQAIVAWNLALQRWSQKRGPQSGSTAKKRTGVPITRKDFTALPLREMNQLWTDASAYLKKSELTEGQKLGHPRVLSITVEGAGRTAEWGLTFEFRHQSGELIHVRPADPDLERMDDEVRDLTIVHVPPFSGIGADEPLMDRPFQDLLIGQGKAGDILRNLLLEVSRDDAAWAKLVKGIEQIFEYRLQPPQYGGTPFIRCEYLPGIPQGKGKQGLTPLDIACAGSGFHQVLLLLAFFYARPATVLLLDEPDAHLHIILQKQIHDLLRRIAAERRCQLIIATHAEVLIDSTSPKNILSFYHRPHTLVSNTDRDQVREALKRLTGTDILLAEPSPGILYVESEDDFNLLRTWAEILKHRSLEWFNRKPLWHSNLGRNPREARDHFFALRALKSDLKGLLLLDGDNREVPNHHVEAKELLVERWGRYEIESYLVHPEALGRFVESAALPLAVPRAQEYLTDQLPPAVLRDPTQPHEYWRSVPASKTILPEFFRLAQVSITKREYYLVANQMKSTEIPDEVWEKLDTIAATFGI